jgi:3-hydroxybutyryl-CoA dehydrogenase
MEIKKICVIGGGLMGRQIALSACIYGFETSLNDANPEVCDQVITWADEYLNDRIKKGRMDVAQVTKIKSLFHVEKELATAVRKVDCIIEAIVENEEIKRKLFQQIDALVEENVIIATNSSYMLSSQFTDCVKNPSRLANMHFYNPVLVMKFVEVVQGPHTSDETAKALFEFCQKIDKTPIWMKKELPGFVANYIISGINERAKWLVQNGYCTYQEVDIACENGLKHPMGPFRLADMVGIDLGYTIMKKKYDETGVKPDMFDVFEQLYKEGKLGRKSGHGFYDYE